MCTRSEALRGWGGGGGRRGRIEVGGEGIKSGDFVYHRYALLEV